ncbi:MAG: hypothetical protein ACYC6N_04300 [Pirellulaceae bacterium]
MWTVNGAVAAGVCALLLWISGPETYSFAQTVKAIDNAETITWRMTSYDRRYSLDGKRTWLKTNRITIAYRNPGLYRATSYDGDGNVSGVEITDSKINKTLSLNMKSRNAVWTNRPHYSVHDPLACGPFSWMAETLKTKPIELVGQREVNGATANVFRYHLSGDGTSFDVWIDAASKQLVGASSPGADVFDPMSMADRDNPPEPKISKGEILGSIIDEIVFDAKLDAGLFNLMPPEGFEVLEEPPLPTVTEAQLIEWLDVTARFNDGMFVDTADGVDHEKHNAAAGKDKAARTDVEQTFLDLWLMHISNRHSYPIWDFADQYAVPGSFQYLGKGVKLGSADRIVCWYKLKSTGTYRAVFGDLTVKDVTPKDLPLPVDP